MEPIKEKSHSALTENLPIADEFVGAGASPDGPGLSPKKKICHFSCKICFDLAKDPVFNAMCGHLFCWSCLYEFWRCRNSSDSRRQEELPGGCPFCGRHFDVSAAGLTVFPVYSGHVPGELHVTVDPESDPEVERLHEEASKSETGDIPPRRAWHCRQYASPSDCIVQMISRFKVARVEFVGNLDDLFRTVPLDQYEITFAQDLITELIQDLQCGWRWLTGKEYARQPNVGKNGVKETEVLGEEEEAIISWKSKERQELQFVYSPTTKDFSLNVSSFSCEICKNIAFEPVVTKCGHLFCWMCLYHEKAVYSSCPVCTIHFNIYPSRNNINPIYCERKETHKEDEFLKCRRRNENDKLLPCRLPPTAAAPFLDYMIEKVIKMEDAIMAELTDLQHSDGCKKAVENIASGMKQQWDELFKDLLIRWRKDSGEQIPEKSITPTFLDFQFHQIVESITKERTIYSMASTLVDILEDSSSTNN